MSDNKTDDKYELFLLEQVKRYGDMHAKCAKLYLVLAIACVIMGVLGLVLGKSIWGSIIIALWSIGFLAAKKAYEITAEDIAEAAKQIQDAIDDPDFDIPDDYPENIMSLRDLVRPTLKNIRSQLIAYGILALTLWAATFFMTLLAFADPADMIMLSLVSLVLGGMAVGITILAVRAFRDLPIAKAYDRYLYDEDMK